MLALWCQAPALTGQYCIFPQKTAIQSCEIQHAIRDITGYKTNLNTLPRHQNPAPLYGAGHFATRPFP